MVTTMTPGLYLNNPFQTTLHQNRRFYHQMAEQELPSINFPPPPCEVLKPPPSPVVQEIYPCDTCNLKYLCLREFRKHCDDAHEEKTFDLRKRCYCKDCRLGRMHNVYSTNSVPASLLVLMRKDDTVEDLLNSIPFESGHPADQTTTAAQFVDEGSTTTTTGGINPYILRRVHCYVKVGKCDQCIKKKMLCSALLYPRPVAVEDVCQCQIDPNQDIDLLDENQLKDEFIKNEIHKSLVDGLAFTQVLTTTTSDSDVPKDEAMAANYGGRVSPSSSQTIAEMSAAHGVNIDRISMLDGEMGDDSTEEVVTSDTSMDISTRTPQKKSRMSKTFLKNIGLTPGKVARLMGTQDTNSTAPADVLIHVTAAGDHGSVENEGIQMVVESLPVTDRQSYTTYELSHTNKVMSKEQIETNAATEVVVAQSAMVDTDGTVTLSVEDVDGCPTGKRGVIIVDSVQGPECVEVVVELVDDMSEDVDKKISPGDPDIQMIEEGHNFLEGMEKQKENAVPSSDKHIVAAEGLLLIQSSGSEGHFTCVHCEKIFQNCADMHRHLVASHSKLRREKHVCWHCGRILASFSSLQAHLRCHATAENHCKDCDVKFTVGNLYNWEASSPQRVYECLICKKAFGNSSNLRTHQRIHSGERPFKCEICGNGFTQNAHLQGHMMTHTGYKPFSCLKCMKRFSSVGNLKTHMRCHTGEKPFVCRHCEKGFKQRGHLKQHELMHLDKRPLFRCDYCSKDFVSRSNLRKHYFFCMKAIEKGGVPPDDSDISQEEEQVTTDAELSSTDPNLSIKSESVVLLLDQSEKS